MTLAINDPTVLELHGNLGDTSFDLVVDDREVVEAVQRYDVPDIGIQSLLRIGAHAVQAASAGLSVESLRKELDHAVERATAAVSSLQAQVDQTVGDRGQLAAALERAREGFQKGVQEVLATQANGDVPGSLVAKIQRLAKDLDQAMANTKGQILKDLRDEMDRQSEYLNRLLREMRDLDPDSALGRAFSGIETRLTELSTTIATTQAATQATAEERERGTGKGLDFEELVATEVAAIAVVHQDASDRTGSQPGQVTAAKRQSLRGDVTNTVGPDRRVVFEAMDRDSASLTFRSVTDELDEAMRNRGAQSAIAVVSTVDNKLLRGQPMVVVDANKWAVHLDKERPSPLALQIAYCLARRVALANDDRRTLIDFGALRKGIEEINAKLQMLKDLQVQLSNIGKGHDAAVGLLDRYRKDVVSTVNSLLEALDAQAPATEGS